jgi:hypothetical protein
MLCIEALKHKGQVSTDGSTFAPDSSSSNGTTKTELLNSVPLVSVDGVTLKSFEQNQIAVFAEYPKSVYEQCEVPLSRSLDWLIENYKYDYNKYSRDYFSEKKFFVPPRHTYFNLYTRPLCAATAGDGRGALDAHAEMGGAYSLKYQKFYTKTRADPTLKSAVAPYDMSL